jgi:hypothetical protein
MRILYPGIFLTLDPGWKIFGSGNNISDPQTDIKDIDSINTKILFTFRFDPCNAMRKKLSTLKVVRYQIPVRFLKCSSSSN